MDSDKETLLPKVRLDDISSFLSKPDEKDLNTSVEDRAECAIGLLQSLPCTRYAVLEKIGEVFFEEAKHFILEVEREHLSGMPHHGNFKKTKQEVQIQRIKSVLIESTEANSKAWSPMIFQWSVQTLGQICAEYGVKRHFDTLTLEERFQMWMECSATKILLEVIINSLEKIIHKNQDVCLRKLLSTALSCSPYFDWVFYHICYIFSDILPYKLLCHAVEAFSNQSRKIDVIIETMIAVFSRIHQNKPEVIQEAILWVFKESLVETTDESNDANHYFLCTIPFLLHFSTKSINLFIPLVDALVNTLTPENLKILQNQSVHREDILQRGLLRRMIDCIKMIDHSSYRLFQFLLKYASKDEDEMSIDPEVRKAAEEFCHVILDFLRHQLRSDVQVYCHHKFLAGKTSKDGAKKTPFLSSLAQYTKQLSVQLLNSEGIRRKILREILLLIALEEGEEKMTEILMHILINSQDENRDILLNYYIPSFKGYVKDIEEITCNKLFVFLLCDQNLTKYQIHNLFKTLIFFIEEEKNGNVKRKQFTYHIKCHGHDIARVLAECQLEDLALTTMKLLRLICVSDIAISEYAVIVQAVIAYFFMLIDKIQKERELPNIDLYFNECDELLSCIVNEYKTIQQFVIRLLMEGMVRKDQGEVFDTEPDEPLIKVELLEKNYSLLKNNRFKNITTSIMYRDGLRLNKRKLEKQDLQIERDVRQYFMIMFSNVLSISPVFGANNKSMDEKNATFATIWIDRTFSKISTNPCAYAANVLVELVCPEINSILPWPDEDFLKYTIERDLKVKNTFIKHPILWDILEMISSARQALYYCSVIIQSLFAMMLKYWQTNRNLVVNMTSPELVQTSRLLHMINQAGWSPPEIDGISDIFHLIKPKEVYDILSEIWKYLKIQDFSPVKFIERDELGRPQLPVNHENMDNLRSVIKITFLRNIAALGQYYHKYNPRKQ